MSQQYPGPTPSPTSLRALMLAANRRALAERFPGWRPADRSGTASPADNGARR